jgi:hypothetical protein
MPGILCHWAYRCIRERTGVKSFKPEQHIIAGMPSASNPDQQRVRHRCGFIVDHFSPRLRSGSVEEDAKGALVKAEVLFIELCDTCHGCQIKKQSSLFKGGQSAGCGESNSPGCHTRLIDGQQALIYPSICPAGRYGRS